MSVLEVRHDSAPWGNRPGLSDEPAMPQRHPLSRDTRHLGECHSQNDPKQTTRCRLFWCLAAHHRCEPLPRGAGRNTAPEGIRQKVRFIKDRGTSPEDIGQPKDRYCDPTSSQKTRLSMPDYRRLAMTIICDPRQLNLLLLSSPPSDAVRALGGAGLSEPELREHQPAGCAATASTVGPAGAPDEETGEACRERPCRRGRPDPTEDISRATATRADCDAFSRHLGSHHDPPKRSET